MRFSIPDSKIGRDIIETIELSKIMMNEESTDMFLQGCYIKQYIVQRRTGNIRHVKDGTGSKCGQLKRNQYRLTKLKDYSLPRCQQCLEVKSV